MGLQSPAKANDIRTRVIYSGGSEAGQVRSINQDSFFVGNVNKAGYLAVVADGMGGHVTGEVASQKAVEIIRRELENTSKHPPSAIAKAVQIANLEIYDYASQNAEHRGMGTTLTTVFIDDQVGLVGHIGDSRAYLIRDGEIKQLTYDHSWVADRVRQGLLSEEEARHHRLRNVITNAMGAMAEIKLDLLHFEVQTHDKLLLCSDGVSMLLADELLLKLVDENTPEDAVAALLKEANDRGSPDNITAVVLEVESVEVKPKNYALPDKKNQEPASVQIRNTMSGILQIEEEFPKQDFLSRLKRQSWYPYRIWILGSMYLLLLFVIFAFWQR